MWRSQVLLERLIYGAAASTDPPDDPPDDISPVTGELVRRVRRIDPDAKWFLSLYGKFCQSNEYAHQLINENIEGIPSLKSKLDT